MIAAAFFKIPAFSGHDGSSMTWIDAIYFATVTVTTIGFGDITPTSDTGRLFIALYALVSCTWVGGCLGQVIQSNENETMV